MGGGPSAPCMSSVQDLPKYFVSCCKIVEKTYVATQGGGKHDFAGKYTPLIAVNYSVAAVLCANFSRF